MFWHDGFNVLVQVDRTSVYYIFLIIIPQSESAGLGCKQARTSDPRPWRTQRAPASAARAAYLAAVLVVWLALLVFSIDPKHLDSRLGIVVTLFLRFAHARAPPEAALGRAAHSQAPRTWVAAASRCPSPRYQLA